LLFIVILTSTGKGKIYIMKNFLFVMFLIVALLVVPSVQAQNLPAQDYTDLMTTPSEDKDLSSVPQEGTVTCHKLKQKVHQAITFTDHIDAGFGGIVKVLAKVLFWMPYEFVVTNKNGDPVMRSEPVLDGGNQKIELVYFLVQGKEKPVYDKSAAACLNAQGEIQVNKNNKPWLTTWKLVNGQFISSKPFVKPQSIYFEQKTQQFYQTTGVLQKKSNRPEKNGIPLVVFILMFGAIFYTIYYRFVNFRLFKHAIDCVRGVFDNPKDPGEVTHFQALTAALSATVGLGNIAGVAIAVGIGGPGAVFWMILLGFLGMTSKFHECTLGQMYRYIDEDGHVHGGAMYYLSRGFKEFKLGWLGLIMAIIFAIFIIMGSFGAGNMFQANQSFKAVAAGIPELLPYGWAFGLFLAFMVGLVIIGGIRRIGVVTEKLIPFMCAIYVLAALYIIAIYYAEFPRIMVLIFSKAFSLEAGVGGFVGIAVQGIRRAVFSNEAGSGSAAIAHSAAKTDEPVREGIVSLLEPFIDTVVICTMTAFVVLVTGAYDNPIAGQGVEMTRYAFGTKIAWFPAILSVCVILFAFSTMISWSYYGERGWTYLFGHSKVAVLLYRLLFLCFVVFGSITSLGNVLDFSDFMFLSMVFPNILGGIWLSRKVKAKLIEYERKLKAGEFVRYK